MDAQEIKKVLKEQNIHTLRIDYPDLHGVTRNKSMPAHRLDEVLEDGITCAQPVFAIMLNNDIPPGTGVADEVSYGDMKIMPDLDTFTLVPYMDGTARMIGDLYVQGKPWAYSPRWLLKNIIAEYEKIGLRPVVASELEFYIFKQGETGMDYYCDQPCNVYTCTPRSDPQGMMGKLQHTLVDMGFDVLYYNHEYFQGQYEFNWKHTPALLQADQTFTFKSVCKEMGFMNDLLITFMGRPRNETGGSGFHIHFSLEDINTGKNLFDDPDGKLGMSDLMRHFIAGQLRHAEAMTAFLAPTVNSYKRFMRDTFAPYFIGWGLDNRTVYIRVPDERGKAARVELRAACASANPYLALSAALIGGLIGIKEKLDPGEPFEGDLYREEDGAFPTVPMSLFRALKLLEEDTTFCDAMGPEIVGNFLALKSGEIEAFRTTVTDWEYEHYSYHL